MNSGRSFRGQGCGWFLLILLGCVPSVFAQQKSGETPLKKTTDGAITFEFNDPNPWVKDSKYSVYIDADNTVIWRSSAADESKFDPMKPAISDLEGTSFWFAGKVSNGEIGRVFMAERPILVRPDVADYQFGEPERREGRNGAHFVVYDALKLELKRGDLQREIAGRQTQAYALTVDFRARHLDRDAKEIERESIAYEHRLWVAEDLANSPAFSVPFRAMGRLFVEDRRSGIGEHILARVQEKLTGKGLVLGVEMRRKGVERPLYRMEATNLKLSAQVLENPPNYPVMEQSEFHKLLSLLSLKDVLSAVEVADAKESDFAVNLGPKSDAPLAGSAVYGSNTRGDFALLFRVPPTQLANAASGEKELFLLLMRPMHGAPEPGTYQAAPMPDNIESLSLRELEELSKFFTVIGLVRETAPGAPYPVFHALWSVKSGEITIAGPDKKTKARSKRGKKRAAKSPSNALSGRIEVKLAGVKLGDSAQPVDLRIEGIFTATDGLKNVGSSRITRAIRP